MSLYDKFGTDKEMEKDGIECNYGGIKITLARAGGSNQRFKKLFQAKIKPYKRQIDNNMFDDDVAVRLLAEVYAETVVLGWASVEKDADGGDVLDAKGEPKWIDKIENSDGKMVAFSKEACVKLFTDLPEFFREIQHMASQAEYFRREEEAADSKNSKKS